MADPTHTAPPDGPPVTRSLADGTATGGGDSTSPPAILPPSTGRYVLGAEIARGGMGVVYRATDTALGREVAVKVLGDKYAPTSGTARRFADEARIAGQLQHPGIPPVHDLGALANGRPFLAMKLIKGDTLDELLKHRTDPTEDRGRFVAVFEQVCHAVAYAHAHHVLHRDLKPSNVMVGSFGEVQVMDWGLAKVLAPGTRSASDGVDPDATAPGTVVQSLRDSDGSETQAGSVLGTPAFMPPEQAIGAVGKIDARSDVFGLGAILAVILTGKPPFAASSTETTRVKAAQGDVAECFERLDGCGAEPDLIALAKRCLNPKPEGRSANAGEVAAAVSELRSAADERAKQAEIDREKAEVRRVEEQKRRRVQAALVMAGVVIAGLVGGGLWWRDREAAARSAADARRDATEQAEKELRAAAEQADRDRRAAATEAAVDATLGHHARARDDGRWVEARGLLEQAERRAADDAPPAVRGRVATARKDFDMVVALDDARFAGSRMAGERLDYTVKRQAFTAAFERYGLPVLDLPPAEAGERVRTSPVAPHLVAGLDNWLYWSLAIPVQGDRTAGERLRAVLAVADPDDTRTRIRQGGLVAEMRRLAREIDVTRHRPDTLYLLARWAGSLQGDKAAEELLKRARAQYPNDFWINEELGQLYRARGRTDDAIACWLVALAARPQTPGVVSGVGGTLGNQKRFAEAEIYTRRAIEMQPADKSNWWNLGVICSQQQKWAEAATAFREASGPECLNPWVYVNLAKCLLNAGGAVAEADTAARRAVEVAPQLVHPYLALAAVRSAALDPEADWKRLWPPDNGQPDPEPAVKRLRELAAAHKTDAGVRLALGGLLTAQRRYVEAAEHLRAARELDRKSPTPLAALSQALWVNDPDESVAATRAWTKLTPDDPLAWFQHALNCQRRALLDEAVAAARAAVQRARGVAEYHRLLSNQLFAAGDLEGGIAAAKEAARLNWQLPVVDLTSVMSRAGKFDEVRAGKTKPANVVEGLELAQLAYYRRHDALAVRLSADAFKTEPQLRLGYLVVENGVPVHAIYSAVRAGTGGSENDLDGPARAALRKQALEWLTFALDKWAVQATSSLPANRAKVRDALRYWTWHPALAPVREPDQLDKLPAAERDEWRRLWAKVRDHLDQLKPADDPEK